MQTLKYDVLLHATRLMSGTVATLMLVACASHPGSDPQKSGYSAYPQDPDGEVVVSDNATTDDKWGVDVLSVRTTADGYMLDFRYRVTDATKAAPLLDRRIKPYLIVEKSDVRMMVPVSSKIGALRQTTSNVKEERNYFVMFGNPDRHVKPGDRVKVVIGDFSTDSLVVM